MAGSERDSRGFHRLGVLLAALALLIGGTWSVIYALNEAASASSENPPPKSSGATPSSGKNLTIDGVDISPVLTPDQQNEKLDRMALPSWRTKFAERLAKGLTISLAVSLGVYGIVRAIGWVIGGFAA
ncbi:MAG: hypothetical protein WBQ20_14645 [Methyloceanibacter sp.]